MTQETKPLDKAESYKQIPLDKIVPNGNYRKTIDPVKLNELAASITEEGVIQPITVTMPDEKGIHTIIVGERRWRAAKIAKLETIPAIVKDVTEDRRKIMQLIENEQREDVNVIEQAEAYLDLEKRGLTVDAIAETIGKTEAYVLTRLKLTSLPKEIKKYIFDGQLTLGHALVLMRLGNPEDQKGFGADAVKENWTVNQLKNHVADAAYLLSTAIFDTKVCDACQLRGRNQTKLFPDAKKEKDVCFNPQHFIDLSRLETKKIQEQLQAKGMKVYLSPQAIEKLLTDRGSMRISDDPKDSYAYPKLYKTKCVNCPDRILYYLEQKSWNGKISFGSGLVCINKKCFQDMNEKKVKSRKEEKAEKQPSPLDNRPAGADMQHANQLFRRFMRAIVQPKLLQNDTARQRIKLYHLIERVEELPILHPEMEAPPVVLKEFLKPFGYKDRHHDDYDLVAVTQRIPKGSLDKIEKMVEAVLMRYTCEEALSQIAGELKVDPHKELAPDAEYLNTFTKHELIEYAKKFKVMLPSGPNLPAPEAMKKDDLLSIILKNDLKGKIPTPVTQQLEVAKI